MLHLPLGGSEIEKNVTALVSKPAACGIQQLGGVAASLPVSWFQYMPNRISANPGTTNHYCSHKLFVSALFRRTRETTAAPNLGQRQPPHLPPRHPPSTRFPYERCTSLVANRWTVCVRAADHRVPESSEAACHSRLYGTALSLAVRGVDVHYHLLDSSRRAHGVLRDFKRRYSPVDPVNRKLRIVFFADCCHYSLLLREKRLGKRIHIFLPNVSKIRCVAPQQHIILL